MASSSVITRSMKEEVALINHNALHNDVFVPLLYRLMLGPHLTYGKISFVDPVNSSDDFVFHMHDGKPLYPVNMDLYCFFKLTGFKGDVWIILPVFVEKIVKDTIYFINLIYYLHNFHDVIRAPEIRDDLGYYLTMSVDEFRKMIRNKNVAYGYSHYIGQLEQSKSVLIIPRNAPVSKNVGKPKGNPFMAAISTPNPYNFVLANVPLESAQPASIYNFVLANVPPQNAPPPMALHRGASTYTNVPSSERGSQSRPRSHSRSHSRNHSKGHSRSHSRSHSRNAPVVRHMLQLQNSIRPSTKKNEIK